MSPAGVWGRDRIGGMMKRWEGTEGMDSVVGVVLSLVRGRERRVGVVWEEDGREGMGVERRRRLAWG